MNYSKRFVVEPGAKVKLHKIDPDYIDPDVTEEDALAETKKLCKRLRKLQASLYGEKQRSVLIVLQALDTAGKDGVINHVLGAMNPLSCRVASFKKPGPEAAAHNQETIDGDRITEALSGPARRHGLDRLPPAHGSDRPAAE